MQLKAMGRGFFIGWLVRSILAGFCSFGVNTPLAAFHGSYSLEGVDLNGEKYRGDARMVANGMHSWMDWTVDGEPEARGLLVPYRGAIAMGYGDTNLAAVALYEISKGRLRGAFSTPGMNGTVGFQELRGPENLRGVFRDSEAPDSGEIIFEEQQAGRYSVLWTQPGRSYQGVAIRNGNFLAITYAEDPAKLVLSTLYLPAKTHWDGLWVANVAPGVGQASLRPNGLPFSLPEETTQFLLFGGQGWKRIASGDNPEAIVRAVRKYTPVLEDYPDNSQPKSLTVARYASPLPGPDALMREILAVVRGTPGTEVAEYRMDRERATALILSRPEEGRAVVEVVHIDGQPNAYRMIQLSFTNLGPYATDEAFMREQSQRMKDWIADGAWLAPQLDQILR